jgi:ABC-2 type transport system ATP-binding protein
MQSTTLPVNHPVNSTTPSQFPAVISVEQVEKQFGKNQPVVKDLSFSVQRGQIFCLLGPSGSGKSTILRMITGFYKPTKGKLTVLGVEPHMFNTKIRTRIGYMPQQFVLFPELTVLENINFMASSYGMPWRNRNKLVKEGLKFVDLIDARNTLAANLSGGMQRRLALASTLLHRPELILMDEPTAGIDPVLRSKFWDHFRTLRDNGRTLFVTTQYVTEADYCDVVAIINRGRLLSWGTPEQIRTEVLGGEVINVNLPEINHTTLQVLSNVPGVKTIQIHSPETIRLIVKDAGEVLKEIVLVSEQNNLSLQNIEPYRPTFDEVFVTLLQQDKSEEEK